MSKLLNKYFREPYINVLCVELGVDLNEYKKLKNRNLVLGLLVGAVLVFLGIILQSLIVIALALFVIYYGYRHQYIRVKRLENKTKDELRKLYPVVVQTFVSLLYTNDNLIKVFLILESYHFHPFIDRAIIILINKYQQNPDNVEIIFAEFCNIFNTSSASLLHQLLVNINQFGVNDNEIQLLEQKIGQEYDDYMIKKTYTQRRKLLQYGNIAITIFVVYCLVALVASL